MKKMIGYTVKTMAALIFIATFSLTLESCSSGRSSVNSSGHIGNPRDRNGHVWGQKGGKRTQSNHPWGK